MRAIFEFGKCGRLSYISHLDLQRFMMRAIRRTELPVSYSQGFNPHPHIAFASALAMGWQSDVELMDIRMTRDVDAAHALDQMRRALPDEMPVHRVRLVDDKFPALMAMLVMADYRVTFLQEPGERISQAVGDFMSRVEVMAMRKTKSGEREINIRPLAISLSLSDQGELLARLMLTPEDTLKPDLLTDTLIRMAGCEGIEYRIRRESLLGRDPNGTIMPLMEIQAP